MPVTRDQIETLWKQSETAPMVRTLAQHTATWSTPILEQLPSDSGAPALGILSLLEMGHTHEDPLVRDMAKILAKKQGPAGDWGSLRNTALAMRALGLSGLEQGSFARGLAYLSLGQQIRGNWPSPPREERPPLEDLKETAFVLSMLTDLEEFQEAVDVDLALQWSQVEEEKFSQKTAQNEPEECVGPCLAVARQRWKQSRQDPASAGESAGSSA